MKQLFLLILIVVCTLGAASGQSPLLDKYRAMALEYNHDLKAAQKNITASMELEKMAGDDRKPFLTGDASAQYTGFPTQLGLTLPGVAEPINFRGPNLNYGVSLSIVQPIYTGGRALESLRAARSGQVVAASQKEVVTSNVCFQTDIQYWSTVARGEMAGIAADFRNSIGSLVEVIKNRVEVGLVDPQDLLMAQVKLNQADYNLLEAQNGFETSRMALNSLMGADLAEQTVVDALVPVVIINDSLLSWQGNTRGEVKIAIENVKLAENSQKINDSKYLPQLYAGVQGSYSSPGYNFRSDMNPNYAVYATLSVPIFEWGKRRHEKSVGSQKVGIASDQLNQVEDEVDLEIQTSRLALSQALERVTLASNSLSKALENETKALDGYNEGRISILEVIESQTYRQNAQINYTQSKMAAQAQYSSLIKSLGGYNYQ